MSGQLGFVGGSKTKDFHNRVAKRRNRDGPFGQPGQGGPKPQPPQPQMIAPPQKAAATFVQKTWQNATMVIPQPAKAAYPKIVATKPLAPSKQGTAYMLNNPGKIPLPADIQEKMERWKARRAEKDKNEQYQLQQYDKHYGMPEPTQPVVEMDTYSESEEERDERDERGERDERDNHNENEPHYHHEHSHNQFVMPPIQSIQPIQVPLSEYPSQQQQKQPLQPQYQRQPTQRPPPSLPSPPLPQPTEASASSLFHPSNQEILKGMVATEVNLILDKLKAERPELVNQSEIMNIVNKSTRTFEDALQQSAIREQRLRDSFEKMEISFRAIQNNIDEIRQDSGTTFVDEKTMKSWVNHFFNDQIGQLQLSMSKDIKTNMQAFIQDKNTASTSVERLEKSVADLRASIDAINAQYQATVQKIYEQTCFTRGKVLRKLNVHRAQDSKSEVLYSVAENEMVALYYPIENKENGDIWMKTRRVNPLNGALSEGWAPVMLANQVLIGEFTI